VTWGAFRLVDRLHKARADEEAELLGLDLTDHGERGWDLG
jgi:ammonia channel protein AmtB